jgi:hypothetical protein
MYNLPEMRAVNARFWEALRGLLVEAGLRDLPESLTFGRLPVPERIGPEILFSQTCGYPLGDDLFRAGHPPRHAMLCRARLRWANPLRAVYRACRVDGAGIARFARRRISL